MLIDNLIERGAFYRAVPRLFVIMSLWAILQTPYRNRCR
jgi:hypothetical protein